MLREQGALQLFCVFMICSLPLRAQILDTTKVPAPVIHTDIQKLNPKPLPQDKKITLRSFYLPAGLITYGIVTLGSDGLRQFNHKVREEVYQQDPEKKLGVDDYLQYAPAVAVYGLNFVGVKGLHNFRDRTIIYLMSDIVLNAVVNCGKKLTRELRPDGSNYLSFPSGHTAHAFASAEFLRREYRHLSPWYGIAGYAVAISTGYLRMYNNRHWLSDVAAGAGVGIASSRIAYWIYPKVKKLFFSKSKSSNVIMPSYNGGTIALNYIRQF